MKFTRIVIGIVSALVLVFTIGAGDAPSLDPHLEPLRPLLEKTWKGEFKDSTPEKPKFDVARWERILNGKAVRVTHSVNDGVYGGESIIRWDAARKTVVYNYFTTAEFTTEGTMTLQNGKIISREMVAGQTNGISEVRTELEIRKDGTYVVKAEYLKEGAKVGGREATYRQDAKAKVVFK